MLFKRAFIKNQCGEYLQLKAKNCFQVSNGVSRDCTDSHTSKMSSLKTGNTRWPDLKETFDLLPSSWHCLSTVTDCVGKLFILQHVLSFSLRWNIWAFPADNFPLTKKILSRGRQERKHQRLWKKKGALEMIFIAQWRKLKPRQAK